MYMWNNSDIPYWYSFSVPSRKRETVVSENPFASNRKKLFFQLIRIVDPGKDAAELRFSGGRKREKRLF